jgi:LuxR family transcriptional regulator, maltose regulon positive regulatory protein
MSGRARPGTPQRANKRTAEISPDQQGGSRVFEVLRSKLEVPPPRPGLVERVGVVDRLARRRSGRVISVVAPPGYGKTTALGQWAASDKRRFAWVSLDHRDNDPVVLLTYVAQALNADRDIDPAVFKALTGAGDSLWARGLPRLGSAIASRAPFVLVLDDVHTLVNDDCLDALAALVAHVPPGSALVLSGRAEARLGLPKLRADGELLELGPAELALSHAEAHGLLTAAGVDMSEQQARALNERAEGWAAGLYLAALWLDDADPALLTAFGGDDRFVTDYLHSEHLSRLAPGQFEFLTRTSVLERMNAPLCDAVLERHDSARMLEEVEAANLLVVPLDHRRDWFRYHYLFGEMLAAELGRREPKLVGALNRRAAIWCEANGDVEAAIDYWAAAGDTDELARLVTSLCFPFYRSGRVTTVERWLELFDDDRLLARYPAVAVFGAWLHALRGRPERAEAWARAVQASPSDAVMPDGSPQAAWAATVRALLCRRGIEQMREDADVAVATLTPTSPWLPVSILLEGVATMLAGEVDAAAPLLTSAAEAAAAGGAAYVGVLAHCELALLALDRGDLASAAAHLASATASVDDAPSADYVVTGLLLATRARLAIAEGRGAQARQALAAAQRVRPMLTVALSWLAVQTQLELANSHLALSDARGAATLYHEADEILSRRPRLGQLMEDAEDVRTRITAVSEQASGWASTLTAAELRLLPLLTTHLSFREIAERLFVSRNTVKTQAISVYRKLDASSRSEAIERATELGLVDAAPAAAQRG